MKRGKNYFFVFVLILVLSLSLVSAGLFSDLWGKITGNAQFSIPQDSVVSDNDGGEISSSQPSVPNAGSNNAVTYTGNNGNDNDYASRYWNFFDAKGVSSYFRTERFIGSTGMVNQIQQEYGFSDFNIVSVKCYFQDANDYTIFTEVSCSECSNPQGKCQFVQFRVNPSDIPEISNSGMEAGPLEETDGDLQYNLVCDSILLKDNENSLYSFSFSGTPTLTSKTNIISDYNPVNYKDKVYIVSSGTLTALDYLNQEVWKYETTTSGKGGFFYEPFVDEKTGTLYVGTSAGVLFSIDLEKSINGAVLNWFAEYPGTVELNSMDVNNDSLIIGNTSKGLLLINKNTGVKIKEYSDTRGLSSPFIYENKVVLSGKTGVAVFDLVTLNLLWEEKLNTGGKISPVFVDKGIIYFGTTYALYALDINSKEYIFSRVGGANSWAEARANPEHFFKTIASQPIVDGERIYLTGSGGTLFALNKIGYKIWYYSLKNIQRAEIGGDYVYLSSPRIIGNYILFSGGKNQETPNFYILDKNTGNEVFIYSLDGKSNSSFVTNPPILSCKNEIVSGLAGRKKTDLGGILARIFSALKSNPGTNDQYIPSSNAWDKSSVTECKTDYGNCVKLDNGEWSCDRQFCTLYKTEIIKGVPNGGILIPNLDSIRLISVSGSNALLNFSYSNKQVSAAKGQKISAGSSGLGIFLIEIGTNYVLFEVGEINKLGGTLVGTTGGNTGGETGNVGTVTCVDSDNGKTYGTYGFLNFTRKSSSGVYVTDSYVDRCVDGILYEAYCDLNKVPQLENYTCPNGCENGKCKSEVSVSNYYPAPFLVKGILDAGIIYSTSDSTVSYTDSQKIQSDLEKRKGSATGNILVSESKMGEVTSHNLIVVGSACGNNIIKTLVGKTDCAQIKTALGLASGDYLIKSYASSYTSGKIILIVTGYGTSETSAAVNYLIASTNLKTSVGSEYRGKVSSTDASLDDELICSTTSPCPAGSFVSGSSPVCDGLKMNVMKNYQSSTCISGKCQSSISLKIFEACPNGCDSGVCLGEVKDCTSDDGCEEGMRCDQGSCIGSSGDECNIDVGCGQGEYCKDGKCVIRVNNLSLKCTDTDINSEFADGKNIYLRGIAKEPSASGEVSYTDKCSTDKKSVVEYFCGGDDRVKSWTYNCEFECENGACKKYSDCIGCLYNDKCYKYGEMRQENIFNWLNYQVCTATGEWIKEGSLSTGENCAKYIGNTGIESIGAQLCGGSGNNHDYSCCLDSDLSSYGKCSEENKNCDFSQDDCEGCEYDRKCYAKGTKINADKYCSTDAKIKNRLSKGGACSQDYQCQSNGCCGGKCQGWFEVLMGRGC